MIEHIVEGSIDTSMHDFEVSINGLEITVSPGRYYQNGNIRYSVVDNTHLMVDREGYQELWLTESGFKLIYGNEMVEKSIDRLMWFTSSGLELEDVHFVKVTPAP